jgi:chromosome segregation ATPase
MRLKKKIEETEDDFEARKRNWERDREEMQRKLQDVERERAHSRVQHQSWREKYESEKIEKEKYQKLSEELNQKLREIEMKSQMNASENNFKLEKKLESIKIEHEKIISDFEKRIALLNQELSFSKKENESLTGKVKAIEKENHKLKEEIRNKSKFEEVTIKY